MHLVGHQLRIILTMHGQTNIKTWHTHTHTHTHIHSFIHSFIQSINHSFIHSLFPSVVSLITIPYPLLKWVIHTEGVGTAFCQIPVPSLLLKVVQKLLTSSSSSYRHVYLTLCLSFNNTCFRRQFLRKMWPILLAILIFTLSWLFMPLYGKLNPGFPWKKQQSTTRWLFSLANWK